ncbi:MAG TPA: DUF5674 family protein [bacterium]|nr:DUF5674 family protein [bacterium]
MIIIIHEKISQKELSSLCKAHFDTMVKFVADVARDCLAVGGELHSDAETRLLDDGSSQSNLWGGNFYPWNPPAQRLEYTSFINIRPADEHPGMEIRDEAIRHKVENLVEGLLLAKDETMEPLTA